MSGSDSQIEGGGDGGGPRREGVDGGQDQQFTNMVDQCYYDLPIDVLGWVGKRRE